MTNSERKGSELGKFEWSMLQKYKRLYGQACYNYWYSVRVGSLPSMDDNTPRWLRKNIEASSRFKIDCVIDRMNGLIELVEVKRVANPGAIGQLLCYRHLYKHPKKGVAYLTLLCVHASNDMCRLCEHFGITLIRLRPEK